MIVEKARSGTAQRRGNGFAVWLRLACKGNLNERELKLVPAYGRLRSNAANAVLRARDKLGRGLSV